MARVTIKDIAAAANVSAMTVSNVINGKSSKASPETVKRIRQAIKDLDYTPNMSARSLVSSSSRLVGVVIPFTEDTNQLLLDNPFYAEIISGIESTLRSNGYSMILSGVDKSGVKLDVHAQWNVDALILLGFYKDDLYHYLKEQNLPILLVDSYIQDDHFYHLRLDDEAAAYQATRYLIGQGHRNIAHVTGVVRSGGVLERRVDGYKRALNEAGIPFDKKKILSGSVSFEWGQTAAQQLRDLPGITAAFCSADLIAAGVMAGLHELGCSLPHDMSVMGFDNLSISRMLSPALTTVDQSILKKGRLAGSIITAALANQTVDREQYSDFGILERRSVATLKEKV